MEADPNHSYIIKIIVSKVNLCGEVLLQLMEPKFYSPTS